MRFLFIISHDDHFTSSPKLVSEIVAWSKQQRAKGVLVDSNPLEPSSEAITVRVRHGKAQRMSGPFARSREKMCAYVLIEAQSIEVAATIASGHPMAKAATIEVRPIWEELR